MTRIAIWVEGRTEEEFVNNVLADRLRLGGIEPVPHPLDGNVRIPLLGAVMARSLPDHDAVTSLVDFYGFRDKTPGESVGELERRILTAIRSNLRVLTDPLPIMPYVQRHEFEGLLFSDIGAFAILPDVSDAVLERLSGVREQFTTPEDINDSILTKPSKRITDVVPRYNKSAHGPLLAKAIGLDRIRAECPRFKLWMEWMEGLGTLAP